MAGTEYRDDRAAFAGTGGRIPAAFQDLPTPCYILDERALRRNGEILGKLAQETECRILLAQKAFSNYDLYPVLQPYLAGTEPAAYMKQGSARKKCQTGKSMHFAQLTGRRTWRSC